ncbi:MAG: ABC transporter ATP-binding protein [Gammaproteobacteria bacterium]|nr:MAG: ABC transporter ATP-binding protein [Gammaproteobacteria bacterium]
MPTVRIKNASLAYGEQIIFSKLNMELTAGKWIGLLGPSGVGKSSLLRMLAGITTAQGKIETDNNLPLHQQIAYMAQTDLLLPWLTVLDNTTLPSLRGSNPVTAGTLLLEKVGLGHALHLYPHQLSGGMRQRVALVRTLLENKPVILMDEPFSALDAITRYKLQALAADLLRDKTVLFITHDPLEALRLSHEIYIMQGTPAQVKSVAQLASPTPREITDPTLVELQAHLFRELAAASQSS